MLELYSNIKKRRTELGLSQLDLAVKVGYTDRSSIAKIEAGKVDLSLSMIEAFASALYVSPEDLMGWDDSLNEFTVANASADAELLTMFHKLTQEQQESVMNLIKSMIK